MLETVSDRRLSYAVDSQAMFNNVQRKIAPGLVTAVAAPYRQVEAYPPITFSNVDEVDLHIQWEQIAVPYTRAIQRRFLHAHRETILGSSRNMERRWDRRTRSYPTCFSPSCAAAMASVFPATCRIRQFPEDPRNCAELHRKRAPSTQRLPAKIRPGSRRCKARTPLRAWSPTAGCSDRSLA